jgi:hypothetical protein
MDLRWSKTGKQTVRVWSAYYKAGMPLLDTKSSWWMVGETGQRWSRSGRLMDSLDAIVRASCNRHHHFSLINSSSAGSTYPARDHEPVIPLGQHLWSHVVAHIGVSSSRLDRLVSCRVCRICANQVLQRTIRTKNEPKKRFSTAFEQYANRMSRCQETEAR